LLDSDGKSVLAENDDQVPFERTDSHLSYVLPRSATYFIKVRAWDHPSAGGEDFSYSLRLYKDANDPSAAFLEPRDGNLVASDTITLKVSATDDLSGSGISHVEFSWHPGDWQNSDWETLGEDWDGSDGWSFPFDSQEAAATAGFAFYARVYDWAGNWAGTGVWNLGKPFATVHLPLIHRGP
jgi:hypothetical protein